MRLYNTDQGPAREDGPGVLTVVDLPDLGDVVRDGGLDRIESAPCVDKLPLADARLFAPVRRPGKVIIVGLNYSSHGEERWHYSPRWACAIYSFPPCRTFTSPRRQRSPTQGRQSVCLRLPRHRSTMKARLPS